MSKTYTKLFLWSEVAAGRGFSLQPESSGDFAGITGPGAFAAATDFNADGLLDVVVGAAGSDDKAIDAGRVFVRFAGIGGALGSASDLILDGVVAGDRAGASVAVIPSLNADTVPDILIGAPGLALSGSDAGGAYVVFGETVSGGIDLKDIQDGSGGFVIKGAAAGDQAGTVVVAISDVSGDGKADLLVAATGNDAGGADAGAAYVVYGKSSTGAVHLGTMAASAGARIQGESAGDAAGSALAASADLNGDGKAEVLVGAIGNDGGALDGGAVYVVFGGKPATGMIDLDSVAAGVGGFKVAGSTDGLGLGAAVGAVGDLNGDGHTDLLAGTVLGDRAYVVFGKADGATVTTADLDAGIGGFAILAEPGSSLAGMTVAGGVDLNNDGRPDFLIGAPHDGEGGTDAGAVYVVFGGTGTVDLSSIAQGIGGTKIVGTAGSLTGASVAIVPDANGDGKPDLLIGASGPGGESVMLMHAPAEWEPGPEVYGTEGADLIGAGYGAPHSVGEGVDVIFGLGGDDVVSAAGGDDQVHGGAGNDSIDGGAGNDTLAGDDGNDHLVGGLGDNVLDGGTGADLLEGGDGNDLYVVDNIGDVVVDTGGNDTVMVSSELVAAGWHADGIETLMISGTASVHLTGDAGNNQLVGGNGNDVIDGGVGDDTEIGGEGNDRLISAAGHDKLVGGAGDDVYVIRGGAAHIEDFEGNDTIDASASTSDDLIDLADGAHSHIEGQDIDLGQGGTTTQALDVQFLQDLTGSFADDIANVQAQVPQIVAALQAIQPDSFYGVSTFRDKPIGYFGDVGDWVYATADTVSGDAGSLLAAYAGMSANGGADGPEAQLEALMQLALRVGEVGFRTGSARMVVLFTDADFHMAGDGAAAGITTANNGDAVLDGGGIGEDYPMVAQVRAALESAGIIPVFAVAGGFEATYQGLVTQLGRGNVVSLTMNSQDVVTAIQAGLTAATTTVVENAIGGAGNDHITGNQAANRLEGGTGNDTLAGLAGDDTLVGGAGSDTLDGGSGNDTAVFAGLRADYTLTALASGAVQVLHLASGEVDLLSNVETAQFADQALALASIAGPGGPVLTVSGPVAGIGVEDGLAFAVDALANASDSDPAATLSAVVDPATLPDGVTWDAATSSFLVDPAAAGFQDLGEGITRVLTIAYDVTDGSSVVRTTAQITVTGVNDAAVIAGDTAATAVEDGTLAVGGTLTVQDVDAGEAAFVAGTVLGSYGSVTLAADGGWTYQLDNTLAAVQALDLGDTAVDTIQVSSLDGTLQTLAITINGAADVPAGLNWIIGTAAAETLTGTDGGDAIWGLGGNDTVYGLGGNDVINGGTGQDRIDGGAGDDTIVVGGGTNGPLTMSSDPVVGGTGFDTVVLGGHQADYHIVNIAGANPTTQVTNLLDGLRYTFASVERLAFADGQIDLVQANRSVGAPAQTAAATEDGSAVVIDALAGATSPYGDPLSVVVDLATLPAGVVWDAATARFLLDPAAAAFQDLAAGATRDVVIGYSITDGNRSTATTATVQVTGVNDAAVLGGTVTGDVTEDLALTASGLLTVRDADAGQAAFQAGSFATANGSLVLAADGHWTYTLNNGLAAVQALNTGASLVDGLDVKSIDGSSLHLSVTIHGQDELVITGTSGNDRLTGTAGNDVIDGRAGSDVMTGLAGDDVYLVDNARDSVVEALNGGTDTVRASVSHTLAANVEALEVLGTSAINGTGNALDNQITGNGAVNTLSGLDGNDRLFGLAGNDKLAGGNGNDWLDGGTGADSMDGGAGNDSFIVDNSGDVVTGGTGTDTVLTTLASYTMTSGTEILDFIGTGVFSGTGTSVADQISGGAGADRLSGGGGADLLNGEGGADTLTGGSGNDVFLFRLGEAAGDVVTDFQNAGSRVGDMLRFEGFGQGTLTATGVAGHYLVTADAAHGGLAEEIVLTGVGNLDLLPTSNDFVFA